MKLFIGDWIYTVDVESYTAAKRAYLGAAPQYCYPAEPAEIEYKVLNIELDQGVVKFGGDIESLISDWERLDELIIEELEPENDH